MRIPFLVRSKDIQVAQEAQARLTRFKAKDCFSLFDEISVPEGYYYLLDCGEDYETASRILSSTIWDTANSTHFVCNTHSVKKDTVITDAQGDITYKKNNGAIIALIIIAILIIIGFLFS